MSKIEEGDWRWVTDKTFKRRWHGDTEHPCVQADTAHEAAKTAVEARRAHTTAVLARTLLAWKDQS